MSWDSAAAAKRRCTIAGAGSLTRWADGLRTEHCMCRGHVCCCRVIAKNHLSELELGLVANLSIETVDEARKLVPSLDVSCGASCEACACTRVAAQWSGGPGVVAATQRVPGAPDAGPGALP